MSLVEEFNKEFKDDFDGEEFEFEDDESDIDNKMNFDIEDGEDDGCECLSVDDEDEDFEDEHDDEFMDIEHDSDVYMDIDNEDYDEDVYEALCYFDDTMVLEAVKIPENVNLDQIYKMFDAAKRALGIVNKIKDEEFKMKHKKNIFANLNKIRGLLTKKLRVMEEEIKSGESNGAFEE